MVGHRKHNENSDDSRHPARDSYQRCRVGTFRIVRETEAVVRAGHEKYVGTPFQDIRSFERSLTRNSAATRREEEEQSVS